MNSIRLSLWRRVVLLAGVVVVVTGGSLLGYRYYTRPVTLTIAVGSIDGEAAKAMSAIASRLVSINAPVRLNVVDTGTALEAAKRFAGGKVDLAVVRGDVGDLSQAQAVVVVAHMVALVIAPPGSAITSMDGLKGRTVGVISGEANAKVVDVLSNTYGLTRAKVLFKNLDLTEARHALQSKEVSALLVVIPLSQKYLSLVPGLFQQGPKALPVLIAVDSAGAIAEAERASASGERLNLRIALDYSSRDAIAHAATRWRAEHPPSREAFGQLLAPEDCRADVDLLIRSGGEKRLSDFLLWESAYAELCFVDTLWPDFGADDLAAAIADFRGRERRFGGLGPIAPLVAAE